MNLASIFVSSCILLVLVITLSCGCFCRDVILQSCLLALEILTIRRQLFHLSLEWLLLRDHHGHYRIVARKLWLSLWEYSPNHRNILFFDLFLVALDERGYQLFGMKDTSLVVAVTMSTIDWRDECWYWDCWLSILSFHSRFSLRQSRRFAWRFSGPSLPFYQDCFLLSVLLVSTTFHESFSSAVAPVAHSSSAMWSKVVRWMAEVSSLRSLVASASTSGDPGIRPHLDRIPLGHLPRLHCFPFRTCVVRRTHWISYQWLATRLAGWSRFESH